MIWIVIVATDNVGIIFNQEMNNNPHRTSKPIFFSLLTLLLLIWGSDSAYQAVNWAHIPQIKSGDHKLKLELVNSTNFTAPQTYNLTFSQAPNVAIAMRSMMIDNTSLAIDFKLTVDSITPSGFITTYTATAIIPFTFLYYMYIAIDKAYLHTYLNYYSLSLSQLVNGTASINQTLTANISQYAKAKVVPFIISFAMDANSSEYSAAASGALADPSTLAIQISSNSSLSRIELYVVVVDLFSYETGFVNFLDSGYLQELNSGISFSTSFSTPSSDYYNLISGITAMRVPANRAVSFYLEPSLRYNTTSSYSRIRADIIQWRLRQCINSSKLYYAYEEQRCYDNCSTSLTYTYGENNTYLFCAKCDTTCLTCGGVGTACTACPPNTNRTLNNASKTCDCVAGFFHQGYPACSQCHYSCATCSNTSTHCLTCPSGRSLSNTSTCDCATRTFDNQTNSPSCVACEYRCLTCQATPDNCTSCDSTTHRIHDSQNLKCPCASTYEESGTNATCISTPLTCAAVCASCQDTASNCTSCFTSKQRELVSGQCLCQSGYTSISATDCIEVCGDGKLLTNTYQCDDGNTLNGDGCSSTCTVEAGFTCTNSNSSASVCLASSGYSISSSSLLRDTSSNQMTATLAFSPTPPPSIVPSLLNLQSQLTLDSYSFDSASSAITIRINILQEVSDAALTISFSIINQTASVALLATNSLELKPYSAFELTAYKVETYLVWVLIGLLWAGSIIVVVFVDVRSFNGVFELFLFVAMAWVGVEGQQLYSLLFVPLRNLRYIFGMNLQLGTQQNLFSVFNIGCIYFTFPLLGFALITILNKRQTYFISARIKRFVLFDLLYGWMMINGFLIVYGLGITTKLSQLGGADIGGLVFGVVYLAACFVLSARLFMRKREVEINPKLAISKKNLFKPMVYAGTVNAYLVLGLLYLSISRSLRINSLVMMGALFLLFLLFALGNILISKVKYMLNLVLLILVYAALMLSNNVNNAAWSGLAVTALLYLQLALNFTFILLEKGKNTQDYSNKSESAKVDYEMNHTNLPVGVDAEREGEFEEERNSENKSALEGQYENHFTVYEPTIKKPLEVMINPPEMFYETNAIDTALKRTAHARPDRERLLDKRQVALATPKNRRQPIEDSELERDIGLDAREVDMDAI